MAELAIPEKIDVVAVPFHDEQILCVERNGKPNVVLKPALESIGVDYWTQVEKLRTRSWAGVGRCLVPTAGGMQEMVVCDVRTFLMLLATIDERRVGKDVAPKLIAYQAEVADAIEAYWTRGRAVVPRQLTPAELILHSAQQLVEHERAIAEIRTDVDVLEARVDGIEQHTGWLAALAFAKIHRLPSDHNSVLRLGRRASVIAKRDGIQPHKIRNDAFGEVNTYPEAVLREAAGMAAA